MAHTPGHMLEILKTFRHDNAEDPKHEVHIIDFRKLKLLNSQSTLSKDLATKNTTEKRFSSKGNIGGLKDRKSVV